MVVHSNITILGSCDTVGGGVCMAYYIQIYGSLKKNPNFSSATINQIKSFERNRFPYTTDGMEPLACTPAVVLGTAEKKMQLLS